jgi:hypothetical protein
MPAFHTGPVVEVLSERPGLQRVLVDLGASRRRAQPERAYVLTGLTGTVAVGDEVVVNTTAVDLGLGTGGWHPVHWNLAHRTLEQPGPGHIMKLRYTSLQADTGTAEEHDDDTPSRLDGLPVAVCGLHSQMAVVAAVAKAVAPGVRIAYVMTDGAALPLAFSDLVADLRSLGLLDCTLTAGNAFGGEVECVTVASALAWARHRLPVDAAVVAMGPGITGTDSELGTTGIEVASILDLVESLGGRPLMALRVSSGDHRARHRGVSHHSRTVLGLTRAPITVPVAEPTDVPAPHRTVLVEAPDAGTVLTGHGLHVTTMGRGPADDVDFFRAAAAAGALLGEWATAFARERPS